MTSTTASLQKDAAEAAQERPWLNVPHTSCQTQASSLLTTVTVTVILQYQREALVKAHRRAHGSISILETQETHQQGNEMENSSSVETLLLLSDQ